MTAIPTASRARPRRSSDAEVEALNQLCEQLAGFDEQVNLGTVDGFLTAVACLHAVPPVEAWLPVLFGDAFDRAFADPAARGEALKPLVTRLKVLREALDPEALLDQPDDLRLDPLLWEWTQEDRERLIQEGQLAPEEAWQLATGAEWAQGVLDGLDAFAGSWPAVASEVGFDDDEAAAPGSPSVDDGEPAAVFQELVRQVAGLLLDPSSPAWTSHVQSWWESEPPSREDLLSQALFAVQDLRVLAVDLAPRPEQRRVGAVPGRNDPCPCGSGRKFKKCHGAG